MQWFVVLPALADLIKRQRELTIATEQARGTVPLSRL
jgi:hypothetical protein